MVPMPQGIDTQAPEPTDLKTLKATTTDRNNISVVTRFDGLEVYVPAEQKSFRLQGGTSDSNWVEMINDISQFFDSSAGVSDAGKPVKLNSNGKIDPSMLESTSLDLYYLLDGSRPLTGDMDAGAHSLTNVLAGNVAGEVVVFEQLAGYLPINGTAVDSNLLGGESPSFYLDASNINAGTINDLYLPDTISSNITGNAATATTAGEWTTARTLSLTGGVSGSVSVKGNANMSMYTTVSGTGHTHGQYNTTYLTSTITALVSNTSFSYSARALYNAYTGRYVVSIWIRIVLTSNANVSSLALADISTATMIPSSTVYGSGVYVYAGDVGRYSPAEFRIDTNGNIIIVLPNTHIIAAGYPIITNMTYIV